MKIGTTLYAYTKHLPFSEAVSALREDGYEAVDYSDLHDVNQWFYTERESGVEKRLSAEAALLRESGLSLSQIHGPWRYPPQDGSAVARAEWLEYMKRSVRMAAYLGAPCVVVHPLMPYGANSPENPAAVIDLNAEHYARLCDYARDYPVTVCLENMPFPLLPLAHVEQIRDFADGLGRKNLRICLDTGHANVCGLPAAEAVRLLGSRLAAMHVHDNRGERDEHLAPTQGTVDFKSFAAALHEIGFQGSVSSEASACQKLDKDNFRTMGRKISAFLGKIAKNDFN